MREAILHRSHENIARARRSSFSEAAGQKGPISEILASERVNNTKKSTNRQKNLTTMAIKVKAVTIRKKSSLSNSLLTRHLHKKS